VKSIPSVDISSSMQHKVEEVHVHPMLKTRLTSDETC